MKRKSIGSTKYHQTKPTKVENHDFITILLLWWSFYGRLLSWPHPRRGQDLPAGILDSLKVFLRYRNYPFPGVIELLGFTRCEDRVWDYNRFASGPLHCCRRLHAYSHHWADRPSLSGGKDLLSSQFLKSWDRFHRRRNLSLKMNCP